MKTLIYSISGFDKPFIEKALHGKLDLAYTELTLNESTVKMAKGFDAIPGYTNPNGWETHFIIGQQF